MTLTHGTRLGSYEIISLLGAGGMGEVYQARDVRLGREVAIKILPDDFARDPERVTRFEREAHLLASLNHQNIAAIYHLEESGGVRFLVLELVPGQTLAERLARGPLPLEEALDVCRQIAEALEAAHEKGIAHRDLKPANIKLTPEGKVKVLDFGLAKAFIDKPSSGSAVTVTAIETRSGTVLGTVPYMSPEQARGKTVDKRADIWAFGCVLYEVLTARRAFDGETRSDTIAAILGCDPDWQALPEATPPGIRRLIGRTLEKDSRKRLHDIADARIEIDDPLGYEATRRDAPTSGIARHSNRGLVLWVLGCALSAAVSGAIVWRLRTAAAPGSHRSARLAIAFGAGERLSGRVGVAVSPGGRYVAYVAARDGVSRLYVRAINSLDSKEIPDSEDALNPFFSPDGEWVAFFGKNRLKKASIRGGQPVTLGLAPADRGGTWGRDGTIVFAPLPGDRLLKVSSLGGDQESVTTLDDKTGETGHRWPEILPGGNAMLFSVSRGSTVGWDDAEVVVYSFQTKERRVVVRGSSFARYASTGHIVYARAGELMAVPFDLERLETTGPAISVLRGVPMDRGSGVAGFAISTDGLLVYAPGVEREFERTLLWVDRDGNERPVTEARRSYRWISLSTDGRRLAFTIPGPTEDVWVHDLERGSDTRLTVGNDYSPIWTPDGKRLTYAHAPGRPKHWELFWRPFDSSGPAERLFMPDTADPVMPRSWSSISRVLAFERNSPTTHWDLWTFSLDDRTATPFLQTPSNERSPRFSPDGRWLAYGSDDSGRSEVYVQPFPGPGARWQISTMGGDSPVWGRDSRELFYRNGSKMMAVDITAQSVFKAAKPRLLFERTYGEGFNFSASQNNFLMVRDPEPQSSYLNVVLNWFDELRAGTPSQKD